MDPENDKEPALTTEQQEKIAHEKAVNEDPSELPVSLGKLDDKKDPEGAPAKEPEKQTEKPSEGAPQEFDAEILAMAAELGIDESKARSYSTVADLERTLLAITSREEVPAKRESEKKEPDTKPEPIHLQASDDLDEAVVKQVNEALDKISGRYDEKTAALEQAIVQLTGTMQANQATQFASRFDDMLVKHGGAYTHELGEGSTLELTGTHRTNREEVLDEMAAIVDRHVRKYQNTRPVPGDDQLVQKALKSLYGGRDKDNGEVEKRQAQFLRRGSSRSSTAPSKQMRAREELREMLGKFSVGEDES
jgi:hypothetical protein